MPRTELDIASNREPQYDSVLSDGTPDDAELLSLIA